jgi:effector-binding domain-containing protein
MKVVKFLAKAVAVLALFYLILCSFGPKDLNISRSSMMNTSAEIVFSEVANFTKNGSWSPWQKMDLAMKQSFFGEPAQAGHKMQWESAIIGNGSQEIIECIPPKSIRTVLVFNDWDGKSYASWSFEPIGDSTKVVWTMEGDKLPFFARGLILLSGMRSELEKDYENGLVALKQVVESKPTKEKPSLTMFTIEQDIYYIAKRFEMHESQLVPELFSATYAELQKQAGADNITGPPMSINHGFDLKSRVADVEIALPVKPGTSTVVGGTSGTIPAGMAIKAEHIGPYEEVSKMWPFIIKNTSEKYNLRFSSFEVYVNDPEEVKDPSKFITHLIVPVEAR